VDYEYSAHKYKITGVAYENNTACTFKVKLFQKRDKQATGAVRYVVEFQRRSGCVVAFSNFYRATLQALGPLVDRPFATPTLSLPTVTSPTVAAAKAVLAQVAPAIQSYGPANVSLDDSTQQCLLDMATSKDSDVQRESVRFLASASTSAGNQQKLSNGKDKLPVLVSIVANLLASKDKEVIRCTTMLVANLAQQPAVRSSLLPLVPALLGLLDIVVSHASVNALLFKEVRRQVARTLVCMSDTCKKELLKDANSRLAVLSVLDKHRYSNDEPLRQLVASALVNLNTSR